MLERSVRVIFLLLFVLYSGSNGNSLVTSCTHTQSEIWNTIAVAAMIESWIWSGITVASESSIQSKLFHQHTGVFKDHFAHQNEGRMKDDGENYFRTVDKFKEEDDTERDMKSMFGELENFDYDLFNENDRSIVTIGNFSHGIPSGIVWQWRSKRFEDGFLYGKVNRFGRFTGHNITFIYPDLKSGIRGIFINGYLVVGQEIEITGERCSNGMKELRIETVQARKEILWKRENLNATYIGKHPTVRDPLERRNIAIKKSTIPGANEGVFAKRDFLPGQLVMYLSGLKIQEDDIFSQEMTTQEEADAASYLFNFGETYKGFPIDLCIDISPGYRTVQKYRSTLGHKINHSFIGTNVYWGFVRHPSFGPIVSLMASKPITKGEELFVNNKYELDDAPPWYSKLAEEMSLKKINTNK